METDTETDMNEATRILFDLVNTPSLSGNERAASEVFVAHATQLGYESHIDEVNNAIAHRGASERDAKIHLVLLGHIDTVPGDIEVRIEGGILHGRGSVDAKGPLVAMLVAGSRAKLPDGVRLTVAGAVGEEASGSIGARHLVHQWNPDACIIGEPSGFDGVTLGYKGRLLATAKSTCPNTHSAGKDPSACDHLHTWWASVNADAEQFNHEPSKTFDQIQATLQSFSSSSDGLNQHATMHTGFRLPPKIDPTTYAEHLRSLASEFVTIEFEGFESAYATDRNDPIVRALSNAIRSQGHPPRPKLKTGTADLNVVAPIWKCPIAAYGPGDSSLDHTPTEHLDLDEFDLSVQVLVTAIGEYFGFALAQLDQNDSDIKSRSDCE